MIRKLHIDRDRFNDKTKLLLKFNYNSIALSLVLAMLFRFWLKIDGIILFTLCFYSFFNAVNIIAFRYHRNLTAMALYTSIISWISSVVICLFSGGINSAFIFVLALIVLGGYVSTRLLGALYFNLVSFSTILIFLAGHLYPSVFSNEVPIEVRSEFSLLSLLFATYLLGWVFAKNVYETHINLEKSLFKIKGGIREKEHLLKEVHHRVKNNLQTVSSLLNLQAKNTNNKTLKELVKGSQNRVISMAMIHEMLYLNQNLSKIEFRTYVEQLTANLITSGNGNNQHISIDINMPDVLLGIDTVIPLGLLINEAVTNSLKYGFDKNCTGKISITLKTSNSNDLYELTISDNGKGFPKDYDFRNSNSLGLKLIHNLSRQLHGSARRLQTSKGTSYLIHFRDVKKSHKVYKNN